ncbi:protein ELYS isoform X2 [Diachasmimorpha longicaudata]|uniref:protein ELYS isoform X2 n=1 Tax=Diachasmimorpha longicaudata TaxID=58733 RepID=UPI0030B895C7
MNDLEDTHCEVRRSVDLQLSPLSSKTSLEDDASPHSPSPSSTLGGFFPDTHYCYITNFSRLTVFNTRTGASISSWTFRHRISSVCPFPSPPGHIPLLLVGLDNDALRLRESQGLICVFDCTISQVLRAIRTPSGVEHLCIITGGASWEDPDDKRLDVLPGASGLACVALRSFDHLIIDLRRNSWEDSRACPVYAEANPAELETQEPSTTLRHRNRERHAFHNLMSTRIERYISFKREDFESSPLQDPLTTFLTCSRKIGCIVSACLGHVVLWQLDGVVRWISPPLEDNIQISHLAVLEPTDDPRPFCYLWVAHQDDTLVSPVLRMFAMLFERKYLYRGSNQYFNLEGEPSMKLELDLEDGARVVSLYPIARDSSLETESGTKTPENSLLFISTEGRTFLFDLNQWYKEQMPRTLGDSTNADTIMATYSTRSERQSPENFVVSCCPVPLTLREFSAPGQGSPEEFFFPNSLSLEWIELTTARITTWVTRGVQSQLLREMITSGPVIMLHPSETFHRCVAVGLIPFNGDSSFNSEPDSQRDSLLSLCLEQRWTTFLMRCVREWSDGSAAYLFPSFVRWTVQRASTIKLTAHGLCIPLFDHSGSSIGEAEVKTLRSFSQQMECLSNVVENLPVATQDQDLQQRALKRITVYLQVLLWFFDVGLLPESQDVGEESLPISIDVRIPYPAEKLISIYQEKRSKYQKEGVNKSEKEEDLFIDELISRDCSGLISQWEREATQTLSDGRYPPPSLQSLLRSILTDCYHQDTNEMENKHQIIIYLLMDLVMLLQGSCPSVDQLVKYPAAFKLSPSLIKLTQALWLLDHEDYHGFLEIMTGQLVCDSDVKDWHHKLVIRTLIRSCQNKLALIYLRIRKPPLSSLDEQGTVISLSVEHGLVQSAFHRRPPSHYNHLLKRFFKACKDNNRLNDILHLAMDSEEEETFIQFLEEEKCEETRLLYYLQRSRYNEAGGVILGQRNSSRATSSSAVFNAYNATLPAVTRRFTSQLGRKNTQVEPEGNYPRPLSHIKSRSRIREMHDAVIRKARETFTRGDRLQIPFVTAPSLSLRARDARNEGNCVMFADRKSYGKRTHDQMRTEETQDSGGPRKRRKTEEKNDDSRQLSISMVFDTPLIKRKNQMSGRDTATGTPHSILKMRRMIQESLSPKTSPTEEEREKRPRQIRFSINQPRLEDSSVDGDIEGAEGDQQQEEEEQTNPDNSNPEASDSLQSPETSAQNVGQSTILSNDSNLSFPLPGPRRRPSLRKTLDEDLLRKSLRQSMLNRDSSLDSDGLSLDNSVSSDIVSSTLLQPNTPRASNRFDSVVCASTVLSPGSSYEYSLEDIKKNGTTCSINSAESSKEYSSGLEEGESDGLDDVESIVEEVVTTTSITTTTVVREEFSVDRTELNDNTDNESNVEGDEKSYYSMEIEERIVMAETSRSDVAISADVHKQTEEGKSEGDQEDPEQLPSDDYDEELLALKYEDDDDNDDVFKSLSNSIEINRDPTPEVSAPECTKKTVTSRFNEEFNITDDESRSVDESLFTRKQIQDDRRDSGLLRPESANITDDESEPEDAGESRSDWKENEVYKNENNSSVVVKSSPENSRIHDKVHEEVDNEDFAVESSAGLSETPEVSPEKPEEEFIEDSTPVRMTRSRRGSSVAPETSEVSKTPRTRRASSLVQDIPSPKTSAASQESPVTPVKRIGKRATSLVKEVLTSTLLASPALGDVQEAPARIFRRKESEPSKETTTGTVEEIPEESEPVKTGRGRRAASVVKEGTPRMIRGTSTARDDETPVREAVEEASEKAEPVKKGRARRGASVVKEGTPRMTRGPSVAEEDVSPRGERPSEVSEGTESVKKGKGRRGPSVVKEGTSRMTRATSVAQEDESPSGEATEEAGKKMEPVKEGRTKRGASVIREETPRRLRGASVARDDKSPAGETAEGAGEASEPVKKGRGKRGASVVKDGIPRMTRGASIAQEDEPPGGEAAEESSEEDGNVKKVRARRGASVVKEGTPRMTRGSSVAKKDDSPGGADSKEVSEAGESAKKGRGKRGSSIAKDADESSLPPRRTRAASVTEEDPKRPKRERTTSSSSQANEEIAEKTRKTRAASSSDQKDAERIKTKRGRAASTSDVNEEAVDRPRRLRAGSVASEVSEEAAKKRNTRSASVVKDLDEGKKRSKRTASTSSGGEDDLKEEEEPKRTRRGASLVEEVEGKRKRGGSVTKDSHGVDASISTRRATRGASVNKDEEEEKIPTRSTRRRGSVPKELPSEPLRTRRGGSIIRDVIPEENSDESVNESVGGAKKGRGRIEAIPEEEAEEERGTSRTRGRTRRAMSVDLSQEHIIRGKAGRRRAASETKDLEEESLVERPRRARRGKEEEFRFADPEEPRGGQGTVEVLDEFSNFVFSPPVVRSRENIQDRK